MADYSEFLHQVIEDGIEAAKRDYTEPRKRPNLEGSLAGFEACRGLDVAELALELNLARERTHELAVARVDPENYWYRRCFEAEVEWVCNVVSAMLHNQGLGVIIPPTARGVIKAAEVLGVADE
jgi:hypothetical protein